MRVPEMDPSRLKWRTSSYSGNGSSCVEVAAWRTSSHSGNGSSCVEVADLGHRIAVRDSKDRGGPVLAFTAGAWKTFLSGVCAGEFEQS
ncbi:DUF397 domain-containing protein [Actinopolymorpha alba]|uniref:DUF397 domain-containing protein n=1 Tax=Actinopolymorpha alba TaxID=533267 RepID=UPI00036B8ECB|nr:DUF397 domain-containing protein [Actinopolymorpha alba]